MIMRNNFIFNQLCRVTTALVVLLAALPLSGWANSGYAGALTWETTLQEETIEIDGVQTPTYHLTISGTGAMADYTDSYNSQTYQFTSDAPWQDLCITKVVIGEGAQYIGTHAFTCQRYLKSVSLPSTLIEIGEGAFFGCSSLDALTLPDNLEALGRDAFAFCTSIPSLHIPASLTSLPNMTFTGCHFESITVDDANPNYYSPAGSLCVIQKSDNLLVLGMREAVIPDGVTAIGPHAFYSMNIYTTMAIPEGVESIGLSAFAYSPDLKTMVLPNSVVTMNESVFSGCDALTDLTLGTGLQTIGYGAFSGTTALTNVYCYADPASLNWTDYDDTNFFKANKATLFHVPADKLSDWQSRFPNINATYVGDLAEQNYVSGTTGGLTWKATKLAATIEIGGVQTPTYSLAISGTGTMPNYNLDGYGQPDVPWAGLCITEAVIGDGVTSIGENAFYNSAYLSALTIGSGVQEIGSCAFRFTTALTDVYCYADPAGLTWNDYYVADIFMEGKATQFHVAEDKLSAWQSQFPEENSQAYVINYTYAGDLSGTPGPGLSGTTGDLAWTAVESGSIMIDDVQTPTYRINISGTGAMADYESDWDDVAQEYVINTPWKDLWITEVVIGEGATKVGENAFKGKEYLQSVSFPTTLVKIAYGAFSNCTVLTGVSFPAALQTIGLEAFNWCTRISNLNLPASVVDLDPTAFNNVPFTTITVDAANPVYYSPAGSLCVIRKTDNVLVFGTRHAVIPEGVTAIGPHAFDNLFFTSISIPEGVTSIGSYAFGFCYILQTMELPNSVATIASGAFRDCNKLTELTLGSGLTTIEQYAFKATTALTDVYCYADPNALTWTNYDATDNFKTGKATNFHVPADKLSTWQTKFPDLNATYVGDLGGTVINAISDQTVVDVEALASTATLKDAVVDDVYYNLDDQNGSGYDDTEKCIVIGENTDMSQITDKQPGSTEVMNNFNGIIIKVDPGKGVVYISMKTIGSSKLAIQVGSDTPYYKESSVKQTVGISYDVAQTTYIYVYAVAANAGVKGLRLAPTVDNGVMIYNFYIDPTVTDLPTDMDLAAAQFDLQNAISAANDENTTNVGDGIFQIPTAAKTTLFQAIATANAVSANTNATTAQVTGATSTLNAAVAAYENTALNAPDANTRYNITVAAAGDYLGKAVTPQSGAASDTNPTGYTFNVGSAPAAYLAQAFTFTSAADAEHPNYYYISVERPEGTVYLTNACINGNSATLDASQIQGATDSNKKMAFDIKPGSAQGTFTICNTQTGGSLDIQAGGALQTATGNTCFTVVQANQATVNISIAADVAYATRIFPFVPQLPEGVKAYSCDGADNGVLTLVEVTQPQANVPYILHAPQGCASTNLNGWGTADAATYTDGMLTGVYEDATANPGTYVLQNNDGKVAFYLVAENNEPTIGANRCYLAQNYPGVKAFYFDSDTATAISKVTNETANSQITDLSGRKVTTMRKGHIYIVNGQKVIVR